MAPTFAPVAGGAERLLAEVLGRLSRRWELLLLVPEPPASHREAPTVETPYRVLRYAERWALDRLPGRRVHRGYLPPFGLSAARAAAGLAWRWRPDAVSVHYAVPTGLAGLIAARVARAPCVLSLVGRDVPGPGVPPGWRWWVRAVAARADAVTYISDWCRGAIHGHVDGTPGVTVGAGASVPPTPHDAAVRYLDRRLALRGGDHVLLAVQRVTDYKGIDVLLRMLAHLRDRPAVLAVAGRGPAEARLRALARELGLDDSLRWLGYVAEEDMPALWARADVFVFHSHFETFGLVLAEAMAAARPIVTVRSTAIPEVVRDGVEGLLVPPGDPAAMASAVRRLLDDPPLRLAMGERGRARALGELSWDAVAERYDRVLRDVLRRAAPGPLGTAGADRGGTG